MRWLNTLSNIHPRIFRTDPHIISGRSTSAGVIFLTGRLTFDPFQHCDDYTELFPVFFEYRGFYNVHICCCIGDIDIAANFVDSNLIYFTNASVADKAWKTGVLPNLLFVYHVDKLWVKTNFRAQFLPLTLIAVKLNCSVFHV